MTKQERVINEIVQDLVQIDPSLDVAKLRILVASLLAQKPNIEVDENFKKELYQQLMARATQTKTQKEYQPTINLNFMNRLKFVLPATAVVAIAVVLAVVSLPQNQNPQIVLQSHQQINRINENAYGQLTAMNTAGGGMGGENRSQSGGGGTEDAKLAAPSDTPVGSGGGTSERMIFPGIFYKYVYTGEEFNIDSDKMEVFERIKGFGSNTNVSAFLKQFSSGLFNISKFNSSKLDYFRLSEDRNEGYAIDVDFKNGSIYLNQNWERWGMIDYSTPVAMNQLPSDEAAIAQANQFLDEYGISRENYGEPVVQNFWRTQYERAADKNSFFVPDQVSVVYPVKISGNEIYDESGNKTGMYVSINVRNNKVTSVGEITGQNYNASQYVAEQDSSKLIKIAENGGFRSYMPFAAEAEAPQGVKTEEVSLGTPKIAYVKMWHTANNQSKELFVPSLIFPVINQPQDFYQQTIVVPLVKEILDSQNNQVVPLGGVKM